MTLGMTKLIRHSRQGSWTWSPRIIIYSRFPPLRKGNLSTHMAVSCSPLSTGEPGEPLRQLKQRTWQEEAKIPQQKLMPVIGKTALEHILSRQWPLVYLCQLVPHCVSFNVSVAVSLCLRQSRSRSPCEQLPVASVVFLLKQDRQT